MILGQAAAPWPCRQAVHTHQPLDTMQAT